MITQRVVFVDVGWVRVVLHFRFALNVVTAQAQTRLQAAG